MLNNIFSSNSVIARMDFICRNTSFLKHEVSKRCCVTSIIPSVIEITSAKCHSTSRTLCLMRQSSCAVVLGDTSTWMPRAFVDFLIKRTRSEISVSILKQWKNWCKKETNLIISLNLKMIILITLCCNRIVRETTLFVSLYVHIDFVFDWMEFLWGIRPTMSVPGSSLLFSSMILVTSKLFFRRYTST